MQDFTAGGIHALPQRSSRLLGDAGMDDRIQSMVRDWVDDESVRSMVEGIIITALKLGRERVTVADMKLLNRSLRELRHAMRVFADYRHVRKVSVFGSARTPYDHAEALAAEDFSRRMASAGYMVITGGGDGIMGAAQKGAGRERSFGLNIRLPFEQRANATIDGDEKLVNFNYFFTRKLNFVKESHGVVLFPGGFGTMDEAYETLTLMQTGKSQLMPLVLVDRTGGTYWKTWDKNVREHLLRNELICPEDTGLYHITDKVDEAVKHIARFYRNFHSTRFVHDLLVIRLRHAPSPTGLNALNEDFADIITGEPFHVIPPTPEETEDSDHLDLQRVAFGFNRKSYGRLRQLIDVLNQY